MLPTERAQFCSVCGERLEKERRLLSPGMGLCNLCRPRDRPRRAVLAILLVVAIGAAGFWLGRTTRKRAPALVIERGGLGLNRAAAKPGSNAQGAGNNNAAIVASETAQTESSAGDGAETSEVVAICGARTRKGKPCSRKVRGIVRCWQHRGMPAMLPPEKLVIQ